ncbi:hypothetical protein AB0M95_37980 [Sphaerisporangium sp. NPDC051017]|uniref:pPIWI_RE_Z domain-containing protein n=1 Tax=Sphaerisporangium sp. NPDC051017 TaxID=3154636 RepID=UPI003419468B
MRDTSRWFKPLADELNDKDLQPLLGSLTVREFCALELGLSFLVDHLPGEPIGALWLVLSGYAEAGPQLRPQVRHLRLLMGDTARSGQWRERLNQYQKIPIQLRGFDRSDGTQRRVANSTVFFRRPSPHCPTRYKLYRDVLIQPVPYTTEPEREPAPPGSLVVFQRADGRSESVQIPDWIPVGTSPLRLEARAARTRKPISVTKEDLTLAAKDIDRRLEDHQEIKNRDFTKRLGDMTFAAVDECTGQLQANPALIEVNGVCHTIGLMNSGKSTLTDLLAFITVVHGEGKVGYVLPSAADVYEKVSFLRTLGIKAVPLVGHRRRTEHVARYWRNALRDGDTVFPRQSDPAAAFTTAFCPLEQLRTVNDPTQQPLQPEEYPCRGAMHVVGVKRRLFDCPLAHVCPHQNAEREVAQAEVWVTTAAGLMSSWARPAAVRMRWIEAAQHHLDLLLVDEADEVQRAFDSKFLQNEVLALPDRGWSDRTAREMGDGLDQRWRLPLLNDNVEKFEEWSRRHGQALTRLYLLIIDPQDTSLLTLVKEGPFTAHSLLLRVARTLHGLNPRREEHDRPEQEEAADTFFQDRLEVLTTAPFAVPKTDLTAMISALTAAHDTEMTAEHAVEQWLRDNLPVPDIAAKIEQRMPHLVRLLQAGIWAARITTSFFEMSTLHPAVAEAIGLSNAESFWMHQPPRDIQAFVPDQAMGNLMALQWKPNHAGTSGSLSLLWLRGVGRWLIHHLHDLLSPEGIDGPNVVLTSATSWMPASPKFHIDIVPSLVLYEPPECRAALRESRMFYRPIHRSNRAVFVSGAGQDRTRRADALRAVVSGICEPQPGAPAPLLDQIRQRLDADRQQAAFVVLSTADAETVGSYVNSKTRYIARHVVRDSDEPGQWGLARRNISQFPATGADILVSSEGALQRGHNLLNQRRVAALGAIVYLSRLHPPPDEPEFPLSIVNSRAMKKLIRPVDVSIPGNAAGEVARRLRQSSRATWHRLMGEPILFGRLTQDDERNAFVANMFVSKYQTIGRGIRGNEKVMVYLCDAAFAPRTADPNDKVADTERTSVIVAAQALMKAMLAPPGDSASPERVRDHALATATWGLLNHLLETIDWG